MEETINEVKALILGGKSVSFYIAAFFFSALTIFISLYARGKKKYMDSSDTPPRFSVYFLIWDNTKRVAAGLITLFLIYRFLFPDDMKMEFAVGIGIAISYGVDKLIQVLQSKFGVLNMDREKLPTKPE